MKRIKRIILISLITIYVFAINSFATTGTINIEATRVRKEKNTTSEILTNVYKNEKVEILDEDGEWVKIKYDNYTGYIKKEFVTINTSSVASNTASSSNTTANSNTATESNTASNSNTTTNSTSDNVSVYENSTSENQTVESSDGEVFARTNLTLRILPNFMSQKIENINQGTSLKIVDEIGKWIEVTNGSVTGWIPNSKVSNKEVNVTVDSSNIETVDNKKNDSNEVEKPAETNNTSTENSDNKKVENVSKKGKINVETAKVRKSADSKAEVISFLDYNDEVIISEENGDWYKISHKDISGYVNKDLITITSTDEGVTSRSLPEERQIESEENNVIEEVENVQTSNVSGFAMQYLGYPYVVGGKTPDTGFDCSGFTRYVFKNFGYNLGNVAADQTDVGREIERNDLKSGDLILFYNDNKTKIGHVGIYLENGDFIHAANPDRGVVIDNINTSSYYNERYVSARRIVE